MWRNTRYEPQDYAALGLAPAAPTWGNPLTTAGEEIRRAGQRFYIVGHGFHAQAYGAMYVTPTPGDLDAVLDEMAAVGVNAISCMEMESNGLVISGTRYGWPAGMFVAGEIYTGGKTWAVGERTQTVDTSGVTRIYRTYICSTPGYGGSAATGPVGTGTGITPSGSTAKWDYEGPAFQAINEQFFTGDGNAAGFDYFLDACARRGIYAAIRFDNWYKIFIGLNGGYALNGRSGVSAGSLVNHRGLWPLDGRFGSIDMLGGMKTHLNRFLDRINSVNGKRYGDDHTISTFDILNEQGIPAWYFPTSSATSPSSNTFDLMCHAGSSVPGGSQSEPNAMVVGWWDAAWLDWYGTKYPGHTPNGDYAGKTDKLPCYAYTTLNGGAANNIAQRATYRAGTSGDGWLLRVAEFLADTEVSFCTALRDHLRSKSSHILLQCGQQGYVSPRAIAVGDIHDSHVYLNATATAGNPNTDTITAGSGKGVSWAGGTLTVVFSATPTRTLLVGQSIRITQTSGGSWTSIVTIATVFTTTTTDDSFTATGVPDPVTIAGTQVSATAELPTLDNNTWPFHAATPADTASTRIHYWNASASGEQNTDIYWAGQSGLGSYYLLIDAYMSGKPATCTELGERGPCGPVKGLYRTAFTLIDLLQRGAGSYQFAWNNATDQTGASEHSIPGDGGAMLDTALMSLMARYVTPFPLTDTSYVQASDYHLFLAGHNSTDITPVKVNGQSYGYHESRGDTFLWQNILQRRLRLDLGAVSSPSVQTYSLPNTVWTHPELNDQATGLFFVWYGMGCIGYISSKIVVVVGRLPTDSVASSLPIDSRLKFSTLDGKAWYGRIAWVSLDGSDLGAGRSAVFTHCYPREEVQQFRRLFVDSGTPRAEMLLDDMTAIYAQGDAATQPGVVMRDGLRLQLAMPSDAQKASIIERYGTQREHPAFTASGWMTLYPTAPLLVLSNSGTPAEAPSGGEQGLDFSSPDNSGYLSLHSIGV